MAKLPKALPTPKPSKAGAAKIKADLQDNESRFVKGGGSPGMKVDKSLKQPKKPGATKGKVQY